MRITHVSLYVRDQDEAVNWFTTHFGFKKVQDAFFSETARWVTVSPDDQPEMQIVLEHESMANTPEMAAEMREVVGKSGTISFEVADVRGLTDRLQAAGVNIIMEATDFPWALQSIIADPSGNKFILNQLRQSAS